LEKERYTISWLSVGSSTTSGIILSIKIMVLNGGLCLGDNIEILSMEK